MKALSVAIALAVLPVAAFASCKVSKSGYDALWSGMSYSQAVSVLGCKGEEVSRTDMAGYTTVMYNWYGSGWTGGNMNAMFQNDKLVSKAQFGLK